MRADTTHTSNGVREANAGRWRSQDMTYGRTVSFGPTLPGGRHLPCDDRRMIARPSRARIAIPIAVIFLAAGVRLWRLPEPRQLVWDEHHYVFDAEVYLGGGIGQPIPRAPRVKIIDEGTWVHPPLGKWMIALLGVGPFGLHSFGWRFPAAMFGIAEVGFLYLLALRLWGFAVVGRLGGDRCGG